MQSILHTSRGGATWYLVRYLFVKKLYCIIRKKIFLLCIYIIYWHSFILIQFYFLIFWYPWTKFWLYYWIQRQHIHVNFFVYISCRKLWFQKKSYIKSYINWLTCEFRIWILYIQVRNFIKTYFSIKIYYPYIIIIWSKE